MKGARPVVALALVVGAGGCAQVWGFSADGGADGLSLDASSTDSSCGSFEGGAGTDSAGCVAIVPSPSEPTQGGGACNPGDGAVCYPHDVTAFQGVWVPPFGPHAGVCTAEQVTDYYSSCGPAGNAATCDTWRSKNAACDGCLEPPSSTCRSGAYLGAQSAAPAVNLGGCVALAEPCNLPCAQALMADQECENAACNPNPGGACAVDDVATDKEFLACITAADDRCGCEGFALTYSACLKELVATPAEHPAATACALKGNAQTQFVAVAAEICGPPP